MTLIRQNFRFILFVAVSAMLLTQSIATGHDESHHHVSDDCVVCKIVEVSSDKAPLAVSIVIIQPRLTGVVFERAPILISSNLWSSALSRAPPAS